MKIVILGSSSFRKTKIEIKDKLVGLGHQPIIHPHYEAFAKGEKPELWKMIIENHARAKIEQNYIKWYYNAIVNSVAVLIVNLEKNGKKNYIGGNVLMEMGFAHVHDKKIFLYNPLPAESPYIEEIKAMYNEIIYRDLSKIN